MKNSTKTIWTKKRKTCRIFSRISKRSNKWIL